MNKLSVIFLSGLFALRSLAAQEAATGTLVKPPPPGSSWQVKISNPALAARQEEASAQKPPKKVSWPVSLSMRSSTGKVIQGVIASSDGHQDTFYVINGSILVRASGSNRPFAQSLQNSEADPYSLQVSSFPGVAWVSQAHYKNSEKKNGVECQHYAMTDNAGGVFIKLEAWIARESGYPVEAKVNELTYSFEPPQPFTEDIKVPDDFRDALSQISAERSALDAMRKASRH